MRGCGVHQDDEPRERCAPRPEAQYRPVVNSCTPGQSRVLAPCSPLPKYSDSARRAGVGLELAVLVSLIELAGSPEAVRVLAHNTTGLCLRRVGPFVRYHDILLNGLGHAG